MKVSVTLCYEQARRSSKYSSFEYCYLFDQVACDINARVMRSKPSQQTDKFWKPDNAFAMTYTAARAVRIVPEINAETIEH